MQVPPKVISRRDAKLAFAKSFSAVSQEPAVQAAGGGVVDAAGKKAPVAKIEPAGKVPVKKPAAAVDAKNGATLPAGLSADSIESLPVLGAMKQFIDGERTRFRRTLVGVTSVFVAVIAIVVAATILTVRGMLNRTIRQVQGDRAEIAGISANISRVEERFGEESRKMSDKIGASQAAVTNAMAVIDSLRIGLRDGMADLSQENVVALGDIEAKFNRLTNRLAEMEDENTTMSMELMSLRSEMKAAQSRRGETLSLDMAPTNVRRQINWRLPVPSS